MTQTLRLEPVADGLAAPVFVGNAGDGSGRLFIIEKHGAIRIWSGGALLPQPFLDISDRVGSSGTEQGLLGLAFVPDYTRSGWFVVNYTDKNGDTVVARYHTTSDPNVADPKSEFALLKENQPAPNHNGGMLAFGPDGYLYAGLGDGGGAGDTYHNGQNMQTLLGKIVRLDVTSDPSGPYRVPTDNPWVDKSYLGQPVRAEIWATGLRNPWRFSFDRQTGDLWIGDVGQNTYEEVDLVKAAGKRLAGGENFGWPIMEGMHCYRNGTTCSRDGLALPVAEYPHQDGSCSVTGGYVYRGTQFPVLQGLYFYGDYCSGRIWTLRPNGKGGWQGEVALDSGLAISSFGEDEIGELYVADLGGAVYRLVMK